MAHPPAACRKLGKPFHSERLTLSGVKDRPARHEFDAVSEDRKIDDVT